MSMEQNENGQQDEVMNMQEPVVNMSENDVEQDNGTNNTQFDNSDNPKDKREKKKQRRKKKSGQKKHTFNKRAFRKDSYSAAMSVVVIAIVVVLNLIVGQIPSKYTEFDISTGKLYTIGDETKKVLKNLDEDITIHYIVQSGNEDATIEKLLNQYQENSSKIKVEKVDPVTSPNYTSQFTEDQVSENSLIVSSAKRNKVIDYSSMYETQMDYSTYQSQVSGFDGEGQLTSAIDYVLSDELPIVYYATGHNEVSLPDAVTDRIQKANLELKELNLLTAGAVPDNAAGLLLDSPESDYSADEAQAVITYLQNGGKVLMLTDYTGKEHTNYDSILAEYGVEVTDGIVVETDSNKYVQRPYYIVPTISASEITTDMTGGSANVLLSGCQGFKVSENARDTLDISTVLAPSESAFVKKDPQNMTSYDKADGDADGPFAVAVTVSEEVSSSNVDTNENSETTTEASDDTTEDAASNETKTTQLVAIASSAILDSSMNSMVSDGNYTLYMNAMKWLVDTGDSNRVSIASKSVSVDYLTVTAGDAAAIALFVCILLPICCLVFGGMICHRRKKR
ncbi:MAG: GldG family protein [Lachnospiraceae bacterium]|nr:GldG family protein [Lachnospiraceae bacterium]HCJ74932.1 ABC transporter [Roseburia sp.]